MRLLLSLTLLLLSSATVFAENKSVFHAAFGPALHSRGMECLEEKDFPNHRVGPRSELLNELVESLEAEYDLMRANAGPKVSDEKVAQDIIDNNPTTHRLIFRNKLSFKEIEELFKRWNGKHLHNASKPTLAKAAYKEHLAKVFTDTYELPILADKAGRLKQVLLTEKGVREKLMAAAIKTGQPVDMEALRASLTKSHDIEVALAQIEKSGGGGGVGELPREAMSFKDLNKNRDEIIKAGEDAKRPENFPR